MATQKKRKRQALYAPEVKLLAGKLYPEEGHIVEIVLRHAAGEAVAVRPVLPGGDEFLEVAPGGAF